MNQKSFKLCVLVSAAILGSYAVANAVPINGNITFSGTVTLNTVSAANATAVTGWFYSNGTGSPYVSGGDGNFAPLVTLPATSVSFTPTWLFNSGAINNFWSVGGFTFDLASSSITDHGINAQGNGYVVVGGSGYVSGNGFDSTFGSWNFSTQDPSAQVGSDSVFSFSASSGFAGVPDGGTTVVLLGVALAGMGIVRRASKGLVKVG